MTDNPPADPLEKQETVILNEMLAALHPKAKGGDEQAIDRVIKIIALKRQLRADKLLEDL